jgi:hypothetical protein
MHSGVQKVVASTNMLADTAKVVDEARDLDAAIMFVPISFAEGFGELGSEPYGILGKSRLQDWAARPLELEDDFALQQEQAGLGLTWDKDAVQRYRVC